MTKNCGSCKWHAGYTVEEKLVWYCENENSENEGCETRYNDTCEDWEGDK